MHERNDLNPIIPHTIDETVGEARHTTLPTFSLNLSVKKRVNLNAADGVIHRIHKPRSESRLLRLVVDHGLQE
jgi:hypothetical protein